MSREYQKALRGILLPKYHLFKGGENLLFSWVFSPILVLQEVLV